MSDSQFQPLLINLIEKYYGMPVPESLALLHERDGQQVWMVRLVSDNITLTLRLCTSDRPYQKVLDSTVVLQFLSQIEFPAPRLQLTRQGEPVFEWQSGCWAYATEFLEGREPPNDLKTLNEVGHLLGRLSLLEVDPAEFTARADWLDDLPVALRRALAARTDPDWSLKAGEVAQVLTDLPVMEMRTLPQTLIHTDVHEGNLLRAPDGRLYLLDWEDAGLGEAVFDLALVLGWLCVWPASVPDLYIFDEDSCRTLLKAYQEERTLGGHERRMLAPAIRYLMAWFTARDIEREIVTPGVSEGLVNINWAIMRSVTPEWAAKLERWAYEASLD